MAKVNVLKNRAAVVRYTPYTFVDPDTGDSYEFKLKPLNDIELSAAYEFGEDLIRRHLLGNFLDENKEVKRAPDALGTYLDEEGQEFVIPVTADRLRYWARVERMQGLKRDVFDDEIREGVYNAQELAMIALTASEVWDGLRQAVKKEQEEGLKKKVRLESKDSPAKSSTPDSVLEAAI